MAQSLKSVNVITLFVEDQLRSKEFYEQIFDVAGVDEGHGTRRRRHPVQGARGARNLDRLRAGRSPLGRA